MATSVRLDDEFVGAAQVYAEATKRSVPKQIEHWAEIGRMGYSWKEHRLELFLLHLGPHENFYTSAKKRRKVDLDLSA